MLVAADRVRDAIAGWFDAGDWQRAANRHQTSGRGAVLIVAHGSEPGCCATIPRQPRRAVHRRSLSVARRGVRAFREWQLSQLHKRAAACRTLSQRVYRTGVICGRHHHVGLPELASILVHGRGRVPDDSWRRVGA
jgi:hypothetical protein